MGKQKRAIASRKRKKSDPLLIAAAVCLALGLGALGTWYALQGSEQTAYALLSDLYYLKAAMEGYRAGMREDAVVLREAIEASRVQ